MLEYLRLYNVGPAPTMELELAPRLNLLTGDNGLGKSFLLDVAWWALTRKWPRDVNDRLTSGYKALPRDVKVDASIKFRVDSQAGVVEYESKFDRTYQSWTGRRGRPPNPGLVIYGHADGGFSVWDPARNYWKTRKGADDTLAAVPAFVFSPQDVWDGLWMDVEGTRTNVCRGLIDDWAIWIREAGEPARNMAKILASLAAPGETIEVGPLRPLSVNDARDYPTLRVSYAPEPVRVIHMSAGLRRIAALAYMLMWSWDRHVAHADSQGLPRAHSVILILDEIEAHLHPRWQRSILRSVLGVAENLHAQAKLQVIASTHSALVLASAEPFFDEQRDKLFTLTLDAGDVHLREQPWAKQGDVVNWLVSDVFGLEQGRSLEAERAIEAAEAWMRGATSELPAGLTTAEAIDAELKHVLAGHDEFWPRWVLWQRGIDAP
jgi:AAA domain, putative AbiEii toxin, Type IV TA system